jgi:hypothetical protein
MTESARLSSLKAMLKAERSPASGQRAPKSFGVRALPGSVEMDLRWIQLAELVGATLLRLRRHAAPQLVEPVLDEHQLLRL